MRILFFTSNEEDYLSDGLLHGLRSLIGANVVDFPKNDAMYRSYPAERLGSLYGRGFSLYRTLDDIPVDRFHVLQDLRARRFDLIVISDIGRQLGYYLETQRVVDGPPLALLDGGDSPSPFPQSIILTRRPALWALGRVPKSISYFKREITPDTLYNQTYRLIPRFICGLLPAPRRYRPISFSFPAEKIVAAPPLKTKRLPAHIVDAELAQLTGATTTYAFSRETDYYHDLQESRFGITTKRAGWDCMRHYEIAANGAVMCFRQLDAKPLRCAPHGLDHNNCIAYRSGGELLDRLDRMSEAEYAALQLGSLDWARANTTRARALQFLTALGLWPSAA